MLRRRGEQQPAAAESGGRLEQPARPGPPSDRPQDQEDRGEDDDRRGEDGGRAPPDIPTAAAAGRATRLQPNSVPAARFATTPARTGRRQGPLSLPAPAPVT